MKYPSNIPIEISPLILINPHSSPLCWWLKSSYPLPPSPLSPPDPRPSLNVTAAAYAERRRFEHLAELPPPHADASDGEDDAAARRQRALEKLRLGENHGKAGWKGGDIWVAYGFFDGFWLWDDDGWRSLQSHFFVGGKPWRVNLLGVFAFTCFWDFCWRVPGLGQRLLHVRLSCRCKL